jgi:hypothetical protein
VKQLAKITFSSWPVAGMILICSSAWPLFCFSSRWPWPLPFARPSARRESGVPPVALVGIYALAIGLMVGMAILVSALLNELQLLVDRMASGYERLWSDWPGARASNAP